MIESPNASEPIHLNTLNYYIIIQWKQNIQQYQSNQKLGIG